MYIDPIRRQTFDVATPISCDNNPQNSIALALEADEQYVLTLKPVLRATPRVSETKQIQSAVSPNTFTAQEAGIYSNGQITTFWNQVKFPKHTDAALKLLGKTILYDFLATSEQHPNDFYSAPTRNRPNPYNVLRVGLHDHFLNIAPLFAREWFADAFIALFGFLCYILTQCGINFSTFLFVQSVFTFLLKFLRSMSINFRLHENIIILSSLTHGFFKCTTLELVTDLLDAELEKRQRKTFQRLDDPCEYSSKKQ